MAMEHFLITNPWFQLLVITLILRIHIINAELLKKNTWTSLENSMSNMMIDISLISLNRPKLNSVNSILYCHILLYF